MEALNNDLVTKLQEMQAETENLLTRTIEYRRQVPQIMKQVYIEESEEIVKEVEESLKEKIELSKEDLELCNLDRSIKPNFYSNKLSSGLSHLTQLESVKHHLSLYLYLFLFLVYSGCRGKVGKSPSRHKRGGREEIRRKYPNSSSSSKTLPSIRFSLKNRKFIIKL